VPARKGHGAPGGGAPTVPSTGAPKQSRWADHFRPLRLLEQGPRAQLRHPAIGAISFERSLLTQPPQTGPSPLRVAWRSSSSESRASGQPEEGPKPLVSRKSNGRCYSGQTQLNTGAPPSVVPALRQSHGWPDGQPWSALARVVTTEHPTGNTRPSSKPISRPGQPCPLLTGAHGMQSGASAQWSSQPWALSNAIGKTDFTARRGMVILP
jgi:hypothetical protein